MRGIFTKNQWPDKKKSKVETTQYPSQVTTTTKLRAITKSNCRERMHKAWTNKVSIINLKTTKINIKCLKMHYKMIKIKVWTIIYKTTLKTIKWMNVSKNKILIKLPTLAQKIVLNLPETETHWDWEKSPLVLINNNQINSINNSFPMILINLLHIINFILTNLRARIVYFNNSKTEIFNLNKVIIASKVLLLLYLLVDKVEIIKIIKIFRATKTLKEIPFLMLATLLQSNPQLLSLDKNKKSITKNI